MVRSNGCIIDLHPTAIPAAVEIAGQWVGDIEADDAPRRHAAADAAVAEVLDAGLLTVERRREFTFYTYADSIEELRDHVAATWRNARIGDAVVQRARQALAGAPGARPRAREQVRLMRLRPAAPGFQEPAS